MTTFCVAYKNDYTTKIDEQRGSACDGWVRISAFESFEVAKRLFDIRKNELANSAVGLFANHDNQTAWFERRPRYLANGHVIFSKSPLPSVLGNVINSKPSDWF